jgi:hypothetical protein
MGIPKGGTVDAANDVSQANLTATDPGGAGTTQTAGRTAAIGLYGQFNFIIAGTFVGTVILERSWDGGNTWVTHGTDNWTTLASFTAPVSEVGLEPEQGMLWRLRCTAYTSGTIIARLSQSVDFQLTGGLSR